MYQEIEEFSPLQKTTERRQLPQRQRRAVIPARADGLGKPTSARIAAHAIMLRENSIPVETAQLAS